MTVDPHPPANRTSEEATKTSVSQSLLLWLVAIGFFMETLDSTIVNTALPAMAKSLGESPLSMYSVVIAYSLTIAILIPASGWIADRFGTRRAFISAIVLFSLGSLSCAFSQSLLQLVASRVLQGTGGAMLLPIGRLSVLRAFPREKFLEAISFVAIPGLIGPLIGPTLGGFLVEVASWHWIFLINIPIGILGCLATLKYMPSFKAAVPPKFDFPGYVILALCMVSLSLALDGLSELGLPHAAVLLLFIFGLACLVSYGLHASRSPAPLFSLRLFKSPTFAIGLLGNLFARIGSSSMPFLIPLFLQVCIGYSPFQSGMMMIPVALAAIFSKRIATRVIRISGYRRFLMGNTIFVGAMIASFALISEHQPLLLRILQLAVFGTVNSLQFSAMNSLTLKDLDPRGAASGNSLFSMVQMLALSFGVATAGAVLSTFTEQMTAPDPATLRLQAFHATYICMGLVTCTSAWIFWRLSPDTRVKKDKPQLDITT